jgi:hypothetical protein
VQELQVPTRRIAVEVFTDRGQHYTGGLFVTDSPYRGDAIEQMLAALNDGRSFLPFDASPGTENCAILNKKHIARVSFARSADDDASSDHEMGCTLHLTDGTALAGRITVDTPWSLSRLLDKLNAAGPFVRLDTGSGHELVRTSHIVRVD